MGHQVGRRAWARAGVGLLIWVTEEDAAPEGVGAEHHTHHKKWSSPGQIWRQHWVGVDVVARGVEETIRTYLFIIITPATWQKDYYGIVLTC